ncbi:MAG: PP2C family protein-serine/threonine phosphatase [Nocardioidaceae bacterium]
MTQPSSSTDTALLTSAAEGDLQGRLRQASDRAAYLSGAASTLSGALHTDRAMDLVLELVAPRVVDWAQVAVRDGRSYRCRSKLGDGTVQGVDVPAARVDPASVFSRVLATGVRDLVFVPDADDPDSPVLVSAVPAQEAREQLSAIRPVDVLSLPLRARGTTYGVLTVAHRSGSGFDEAAAHFLEDFAAHVAATLDTTRALAESRRVAAVLSRGLTPPELPSYDGVEFSSYYRVAFEQEALGGDFYDVHGAPDDWTAVVGDVCGKGVDAAVLTGRIRQSARTAAHVDRDPGRLLDLVNRTLLADPEDTFVTAVCARGRRTGESLQLDIASAGHPEPLVVRSDGTVEQVAVGGPVLGLVDGSYSSVSVRLSPGETCLLFTDGVLEAPGRRDRFGDQRLRDVVHATGPVEGAAVVEAVAMALSAHLGDRAHDDIAILAVQAGRPA